MRTTVLNLLPQHRDESAEKLRKELEASLTEGFKNVRSEIDRKRKQLEMIEKKREILLKINIYQKEQNVIA